MHGFLLALLTAAVAQAPQAAQAPTQAAAIDAAKHAIVRDIEDTLPRVTVEVWLRELAGAQAPMTWELNDCGEQTGSPADRGRDIPMCAEVQVELSGNRRLSLSLAVGSTRTGLSAKPAFFFGHLTGPDRSKMIWIKTLAEVPKVIGKPARPGGATNDAEST